MSAEIEPSWDQYRAAIDAFHEVVKDLDVDWVARSPIQGEATPKVFAYRIAKAALNAPDGDTQPPNSTEQWETDGGTV